MACNNDSLNGELWPMAFAIMVVSVALTIALIIISRAVGSASGRIESEGTPCGCHDKHKDGAPDAPKGAE